MNCEQKKRLREQYKQRKSQGGIFRIRNTENERYYMLSTDDMAGSRNSFEFSKTMGKGPFYPPMREDYERYGPEAFCFEVLEELEQGETMNREEFLGELKVLLELWREQSDSSLSYINWDAFHK